MTKSSKCPKCAQQTQPADTFCGKCGASLEPAVSEAASGTRWKWVAISGGVAFAVQVVIVIGVLVTRGEGVMEQIMQGKADAGTLISFAAAVLAGYFFAGAGVAYMSPGLTLREPAIGAALAVVGSNLMNGGGGVLAAWILPYLLALTGARFGERLQGGSRSRNSP